MLDVLLLFPSELDATEVDGLLKQRLIRPAEEVRPCRSLIVFFEASKQV